MPRQVNVTLPGQKVPLEGADKENIETAGEGGREEGRGREGGRGRVSRVHILLI